MHTTHILIGAAADEQTPAVPHANECQSLSNTVWSYAQLVITDRPLLDAIAAESIPRIAQFCAQDLANTSWALSPLASNN